MSIFKEGIHYVLCPNCGETIELSVYSHKHRAVQLGGLRIVCNNCVKPFKLTPVITFKAEK